MDSYPKVFCVEANAICRLHLEIILRERMGLVHVVIFSDSRNFEDRLDEFPFIPDIILLDIQVTPLSGFEMLDILRRHPVYRDKPVAAMYVFATNDEINQFRTAGFNGALAKPIQEATFPSILSQLLGGNSTNLTGEE